MALLIIILLLNLCILMPTDYPSGASVQQPQSPPTLQIPSSERLPLQQQSPRSSVATPRTTQHQLTSSTDGQQTKIGR